MWFREGGALAPSIGQPPLPGILKCSVEMFSVFLFTTKHLKKMKLIVKVSSRRHSAFTCRNAHRHDTVSRHARPQTVIHAASPQKPVQCVWWSFSPPAHMAQKRRRSVWRKDIGSTPPLISLYACHPILHPVWVCLYVRFYHVKETVSKSFVLHMSMASEA